MLLKNKNAVITGCSRGIGKKILKVFSENGANIFACVRNPDQNFTSFVKELEDKYKNKIEIIEFDLSKYNKVKDAANKILTSKK